MSDAKCRFCNNALIHTFCDLGSTPLSNAFLKAEELTKPEPSYPLHVYVCSCCFLVQLEEFEKAENIFSSDYAYFSSYSNSWLDHCSKYANQVTKKFGLNSNSQVIEIASNDGYLLGYFLDKKIKILGIEPAANVAEAAEKKGIPTLQKFFGMNTANELIAKGTRADLLIGNNVLAHVPNINDFVAGMKLLLAPKGVITMEFPHVMHLMAHNQFDTIYHEHFSYLSLITTKRIFEHHGLEIFDVDELPTHGGSLRIYAKHTEDSTKQAPDTVSDLVNTELHAGLDKIETYTNFQSKADAVKHELTTFLIAAQKAGKKIIGYGAPAKGNTLLNFCNVNGKLIQFTVDKNPHKQGRYLPGTHIPIFSPEVIATEKPDYVLILPWNLRKEVCNQLSYIREWGGKCVVPIPEIEVIN